MGKTANQYYKTFGLESGLIKINSKLKLGCKIYVWRQPELYTLNMRESQKKTGLLAVAKAQYMLNKDLGTTLDIGYKTRGYVQGEVLDNSIILRAGFSYILR